MLLLYATLTGPAAARIVANAMEDGISRVEILSDPQQSERIAPDYAVQLAFHGPNHAQAAELVANAINAAAALLPLEPDRLMRPGSDIHARLQDAAKWAANFGAAQLLGTLTDAMTVIAQFKRIVADAAFRAATPNDQDHAETRPTSAQDRGEDHSLRVSASPREPLPSSGSAADLIHALVDELHLLAIAEHEAGRGMQAVAFLEDAVATARELQATGKRHAASAVPRMAEIVPISDWVGIPPGGEGGWHWLLSRRRNRLRLGHWSPVDGWALAYVPERRLTGMGNYVVASLFSYVGPVGEPVVLIDAAESPAAGPASEACS